MPTNNKLTLTIAILSILVIIYLLLDLKSLQPFTNLEQRLNTLINDDKTGINQALSKLETELGDPNFELGNVNQNHLNNLRDKIVNHQNQRENIDLTSLKIKDLKSQVEDLDLLMTKRGLEKISQTFKGIKSQNNGLDVAVDSVGRNTYLVN